MIGILCFGIPMNMNVGIGVSKFLIMNSVIKTVRIQKLKYTFV